MRQLLRAAVAALVLCAPLAAYAAPPLLPHRAVYDLKLDQGTSTTKITNLNGRLVIELMGSACEGYTVNFRLVSRFADADGKATTSDLRSSTHEDGKGETFRFVTRNYVNEALSEETDGNARREGGQGIAVNLRKPAEKTVELGQATLFPTEHLSRIIGAAEKGEGFLQADIYDGSETGEKIYSTSAVIGREGGKAPKSEALKSVRHWPVVISYFDGEKPGEQLPVYELAFDMFANGVSGDLKLDYGEFAVRGTLATLDVLSAAPCEN